MPKKFACDPEEFSLVTLAFPGSHRARLRVGRSHFRHFHLDIGMATKRMTKGSCDVVCTYCRRGKLIQQGLELVIVVLVDQRYLDVTRLGECSSTSQAGEAAAYNYDVRFWTLWIQGMLLSP